MEYFMQFHWWYILIALFLLICFTGKHRGGVVVKRFTADIEVLDPHFETCDIQADYSIFKEGKPHHFEIEIEELTIPIGDELLFLINGKILSTVTVKKDKEAEFDYWSDEGIYFPGIKEGDELLVRYQKTDVIRGVFHQN